jgi:hypothetical protein
MCKSRVHRTTLYLSCVVRPSSCPTCNYPSCQYFNIKSNLHVRRLSVRCARLVRNARKFSETGGACHVDGPCASHDASLSATCHCIASRVLDVRPTSRIARRFLDGRPTFHIVRRFLDARPPQCTAQRLVDGYPSLHIARRFLGCHLSLHIARFFLDGRPPLHIARRFRDELTLCDGWSSPALNKNTV